MTDLRCQSELLDRSNGIAAANHAEANRRGDRFGHAFRAGVERRFLENAHGAVPEYGPSLGDDLGKGGNGRGTDVEDRLVFWHVVRGDYAAFAIDRWRNDCIR